jgi:hypothetical protein
MIVSDVFQSIRAQVKEHGEIPVELDMGYTVLFSTLSGNLPINDKITGQILNFPLNLTLRYNQIPNTMGYFPVNTRAFGTLGDAEIEAELKYRMYFSTIAGNIPVVNQVIWNWNGQMYRLKVPTTFVTAAALGGGRGEVKSKKVHGGGDAKYVKGVLKQPDEIKDTGTGILQEAGRPIPQGITGTVGDIEIDLKFQFTYYINTSSGRSPINIRAVGVLRDL